MGASVDTAHSPESASMGRRLAFRRCIPPEPAEMALPDDDHGAGHLAEHVEIDSDDAVSEVSSILSENES